MVGALLFKPASGLVSAIPHCTPMTWQSPLAVASPNTALAMLVSSVGFDRAPSMILVLMPAAVKAGPR